MIKLHDSEGRPFLLDPAAIESIKAAGPSSSNVRTVIRTKTGKEFWCSDSLDSIEKLITPAPQKPGPTPRERELLSALDRIWIEAHTHGNTLHGEMRQMHADLREAINRSRLVVCGITTEGEQT